MLRSLSLRFPLVRHSFLVLDPSSWSDKALLFLVPATRYARTLEMMLGRARQRNVLPARSHPGGPVDDPNAPSSSTAPPAAAEHQPPAQPDRIPSSIPSQGQPISPGTGEPLMHPGQMPMQMQMAPSANGLQHPYGTMQNPPSSVAPFDSPVTPYPPIASDAMVFDPRKCFILLLKPV